MRINLLAGPGAGKSTTAAWLFSELKNRKVSIELVTEYVKSWAIQKKEVKEFDQVYLFGKQMNYEHRFLSNGIKNIVTDSPLFLSYAYSEFYFPHLHIGDGLLSIIKEYDKRYPSCNIFLRRKNKEYISEGRYQSKDQAVDLDKKIDELASKCLDNVCFLDYDDRGTILEYVLQNIDL